MVSIINGFLGPYLWVKSSSKGVALYELKITNEWIYNILCHESSLEAIYLWYCSMIDYEINHNFMEHGFRHGVRSYTSEILFHSLFKMFQVQFFIFYKFSKHCGTTVVFLKLKPYSGCNSLPKKGLGLSKNKTRHLIRITEK